MNTLALIAAVGFVTALGFGQPDPSPTNVYSSTGQGFQADKSGSDWKFSDLYTPFDRTDIQVSDNVSSVYGAKGFHFSVPPGTYTVRVIVTARHDGRGTASINHPILTHSEQGGINTGPEFIALTEEFRECVFTADRPVKARELNDVLYALTRAVPGNDADVGVEMLPVRIEATLIR